MEGRAEPGRRIHVDDQELLDELPAHRQQPPVGRVRQAFAVERDDVLPVVGRARGVHIYEGLSEPRDVLADERVALVPLAGVEGRRIDVDEDLGAAGRQLRQGLDGIVRVPHVLADRDAQPHATPAEDDVDRGRVSVRA